jgi:hypothetical protein
MHYYSMQLRGVCNDASMPLIDLPPFAFNFQKPFFPATIFRLDANVLFLGGVLKEARLYIYKLSTTVNRMTRTTPASSVPGGDISFATVGGIRMVSVLDIVKYVAGTKLTRRCAGF